MPGESCLIIGYSLESFIITKCIFCPSENDGLAINRVTMK